MTPAPLLHSAFYRFTPLADPAGAAQALRRLAAEVAAEVAAEAAADGAGVEAVLHGSIVVAAEGVNGAVAGPAALVQAFEDALRSGRALGGALAGLRCQRSACRTPPFGRLKVALRPEIVALGLPGGAALPPPDAADASHLSPAAWRALLARGDAVLLDNRNHWEWRLGRFRGALDPGVDHFRDFAAWVRAQAPGWRQAGRPVAMYCTGGIRCDKTAPWLRSLGLAVYQLDGGILNYCRSLPDAAREWDGACFVFDRRIALDSRLQETGLRAEQVYDPARPDEAWRLARARRLDAGGAAAAPRYPVGGAAAGAGADAPAATGMAPEMTPERALEPAPAMPSGPAPAPRP